MNSREPSVPDPANSAGLLSTDKFKGYCLPLDELTQLVQSFWMPREDPRRPQKSRDQAVVSDIQE